MNDDSHGGPWRGLVPPQLLFARREFLGVALEPPDTRPGDGSCCTSRRSTGA